MFPIGCPWDHYTICYHPAAICHGMSPMLKSTGEWVTLGQNLGRKGLTNARQNFNTIWGRHGAVICKRNRVDIFCRLSTMHKRDKQTDRQRDHGMQSLDWCKTPKTKLNYNQQHKKPKQKKLITLCKQNQMNQVQGQFYTSRPGNRSGLFYSSYEAA